MVFSLVHAQEGDDAGRSDEWAAQGFVNEVNSFYMKEGSFGLGFLAEALWNRSLRADQEVTGDYVTLAECQHHLNVILGDDADDRTSSACTFLEWITNQ